MRKVEDGQKPHLSPSQLGMYFKCGEAYRRRYIEGHKIPPGINMLKGTGVHKAQETHFKQVLEKNGVGLTHDQTVDAAVAGFETSKEVDGYVLDENENNRGANVVIGEATDSVARMARVLATDVLPQYKPKAVETKHRVTLPGDFDLLGVLDLETEDGGIQDTKTSAKKKSQNDIDQDDQFTFYETTYRAIHKKAPSYIQIDNIVDTPKGNKTYHVPLRTTRTKKDIKILVNRINTMSFGVKQGVFPPAPRGFWACSPKYCGYWNTCSFVNSERKAAAEATEKKV